MDPLAVATRGLVPIDALAIACRGYVSTTTPTGEVEAYTGRVHMVGYDTTARHAIGSSAGDLHGILTADGDSRALTGGD